MNSSYPKEKFDQYAAGTGVPVSVQVQVQVPVHVPQGFQQQPRVGAWSSGLCECFSDCPSCKLNSPEKREFKFKSFQILNIISE